MSKKKPISKIVTISIVVLVVGLLGIGGYVVKQMFFNEPAQMTIQPDDAVPQSEPDDDEETVSTEAGSLPNEETSAAAQAQSADDWEKRLHTFVTGTNNYVITQWGLTGYNNSGHSLSYEISNAKDLSFFSKELSGDDCSPTTRMGIISQRTGEQLMGTVGEFAFNDEATINMTITKYLASGKPLAYLNKKIGLNYYFLIPPQDSCSLPSSSKRMDIEVFDGVINLFNTLEAI